MRTRDIKKLRWGTMLFPTMKARKTLGEMRVGIFVGITKKGDCINVIVSGTSYPYAYDPTFWRPAEGNHILGGPLK